MQPKRRMEIAIDIARPRKTCVRPCANEPFGCVYVSSLISATKATLSSHAKRQG
jgi:hypothetical protein